MYEEMIKTIGAIFNIFITHFFSANLRGFGKLQKNLKIKNDA